MRWQREGDDLDEGRDPEPLSNLVDRLSRSIGGPGTEVLLKLHSAWPWLVGEALAQHCRPVGVDGGCLAVVADGSAWASQLRWTENEVLSRLAELTGSDEVTALRVRVRNP